MNRIKPFLNRTRNRERGRGRFPPLRDEKSLKKIINRSKRPRRIKKLIDIIKSYNKGESTKLPNEEILNVKSYEVYPNYQEGYVTIINTYQVGGYEY